MNAIPRHRLPRLPRPLVGFLLALGLAALPAGAAARDWFDLSPWRLLSALWESIGLEADPGGRPAPGLATGGIGLIMDPSGRPAPGAVTGYIGLVADPGGQPTPSAATGDIGLEMDPSGQPRP